MKILIIGASGRVGRCVTQRALARNHSVTAFVRTRSIQEGERLAVVLGDPRKREDVLSALPGHDALISCLGHNSTTTPWLGTEAAEIAIESMQRVKIKRYIVLSGALLFPSINPFVIAMKIILARRIKDGRAMEAMVRASHLDWTIVRPCRLRNGDLTVGYRAKAGGFPSNRWSMQLTDLAAFVLDAVEQQKFIRQIVGVGSA